MERPDGVYENYVCQKDFENLKHFLHNVSVDFESLPASLTQMTLSSHCHW